MVCLFLIVSQALAQDLHSEDADGSKSFDLIYKSNRSESVL